MARLTHGLVKLDDQYAIYLAQHSAASFSSGISLISPVDNRVAIDADRDQQCFARIVSSIADLCRFPHGCATEPAVRPRRLGHSA
jgi:hypothetical protein